MFVLFYREYVDEYGGHEQRTLHALPMLADITQKVKLQVVHEAFEARLSKTEPDPRTTIL